MLDNNFVTLFDNFIKQYNSDILNNVLNTKSLLLDFAKGEYKKEIRLLLQSIELGCHTEIINSSDLNLTRITLIKRLQDECIINENVSSSIIDLLMYVLRNYKTNNLRGTIIKQKINNKQQTKHNAESQTITHNYEKEAKAERFYQMALKCLFKDIINNLTLAIDNVIKAIRLCPNDKRFHFFISYCYHKVNDTESLLGEIEILQELGYDANICTLIQKDILSSKQGNIANCMYNAYRNGGDLQLSAAQSSVCSRYKIDYSQSMKIFNKYKDFVEWSVMFDKNLSGSS